MNKFNQAYDWAIQNRPDLIHNFATDKEIITAYDLKHQKIEKVTLLAALKQGLLSRPRKAGNYGVAIAGDKETAICGDGGFSKAGIHGRAIVGNYGLAYAKQGGHVKAGINGILQIVWWDGKRPRIATAYVGENGIKANVFYTLTETGEFTRAD